MKRAFSLTTGLLTLLLLPLAHLRSTAQSPGFIVKPATGAGQAILDPNGDGYTSEATTGFAGNDVAHAQTELNFRTIRPLYYEPIGDLLRGPSGGFSDLVTAVDSSGCYMYTDGTNLIFRLRLGNYIPGSRGDRIAGNKHRQAHRHDG